MSDTMISTPSYGEKGTTQRASQGASMAATGAATGAAVGSIVPGVGTAIGAVVGGALGLVGGLVSGNMGDAANLYANKANAWAKVGQEREAAIARRDYIRQFRMARAASMLGIGAEEGGTRSSAPQGAVGGLGNQLAGGLAYAEGQHKIQRNYSKAMNKAKKFSAASETTFAMFDAGFQVAGAVGSVYGSRPKAPSGGVAPMGQSGYVPSWTENYLSGAGQKFSWNVTGG